MTANDVTQSIGRSNTEGYHGTLDASCKSIPYVDSGNLLRDSEHIIDSAQSFSRAAVNVALVRRNWLLGRRIAEEALEGENRADYGKRVIHKLAKELTKSRGRGFAAPTLYRFVQFYRMFPNIFSTPSIESSRLLSWSHYSILLRVDNKEARDWYEQEALREGWSVRTLDRNVGTLYYERLLMSQDKEPVEYVRMYDDLKRRDDDNPTLGIVLCTETSETMARYSVLHDSEQLFAAEYKLYLPTEDELRNEIENQKLMFALQHGDEDEINGHES